jgi:Tol biopolymer transport system component
MSRVLRASLLLLFLVAPIACAGTPAGQIDSVSVSPDGKTLAVAYEKGHTIFIYKVAVDSGIATRLTNATTGEETSPSFSPDGKRIAYTYWPGAGARSRIVIVNVDGSNPREWSPSGVADLSPVLSPDNKTIVFSRSEFFGSYSPIAQPHPHAWSFYASDLDGTNIREITNEGFYMASHASISPDGKSMVIVAEGLETNEHIAIYSLTDPGPPTRTLQPHVPKEVDHKNPIFACPNYLPDGRILFMAADRRVDYDVYRLNPETGAIEKLTNRNGYATELKVSADGKTAAFLKWRKNWLGEVVDPQIYLLDLQSHNLTPLKVSGLN